MKPFPLLQKMRANPGCVLYFPRRRSNQLVKGTEVTRRGLGEEWVQLRWDDVFEAEVRLEGDNALPLGNVLKAEVIAKLKARVDDGDFKTSVPRVVARFQCPMTKNTKDVFGKGFFEPAIRNMFLEKVYGALRGASYQELLQNSASHWERIEANLRGSIQEALAPAGCAVIECRIHRFAPLDPGVVDVPSEIVAKWREWKRAQAKAELDDEQLASELENLKRLNDAAAKQKAEKEINDIRLEEAAAKRDFEVAMQEFEVDIERAKKEKDNRLAEIKDEVAKLHQAQQRRLIENKIELEHLEFQQREGLRNEEEEGKRKREEVEKEHRAAMQSRELGMLDDQLKAEQLRHQLSEVKTKVDRAEGLVAAEVTREKLRAANVVKLEELEIRSKAVCGALEKLAEVIGRLPIERIGETTVVQVQGGQSTGQETINSAAMVGLAYLPLVRRIVDEVGRLLAGAGYTPDTSGEEELEAASTGRTPAKSAADGEEV